MEEKINEQMEKQEVNLYKANIDDQAMNLILTKDCSKVQFLQLQLNKITAKGISMFSQLKWNCLTRLQLSCNQIGNRGCKYLSKTILDKLQLLYLANNQIGTEGVMHLSKAKWSNLQEICLSDNQIGCDGVKWLAKARYDQIILFSLDQNKLTMEQARNLLLFQFKEFRYVELGEQLISPLERQETFEQLQNLLNHKFGNSNDQLQN